MKGIVIHDTLDSFRYFRNLLKYRYNVTYSIVLFTVFISYYYIINI